MGNNRKKVSDKQLKAIRRNCAIKANQAKKAKPSSANTAVDNIDMHLARIPNKYMFKSDKPEDYHTYAVYKDDKTKEVRAVQTTHLYIADSKNMDKVKKGILYKMKFAGYETPSGVDNCYYNKGIDDKPINLNKADIDIDKTPLPYNQAKIIKDFAKNPRKHN